MDQPLVVEVFWLVPSLFQYCQRLEEEPSRTDVVAPATSAFNRNELECRDLPESMASLMTPATVRGQ